MSSAAILFQFEDQQAAEIAFDTLKELGYEPVFHQGEQIPTLHIHVESSDLTSALEIAQANGGRFIETQDGLEGKCFDIAYNMEQINIPAHVVNEDWPEGYADMTDPQSLNANHDFTESFPSH